MSKLDYNGISDVVMSLDQEFTAIRDDAQRRLDLYSMRREPYVPDEIAREGKVRINSPAIIYAAQSIRADLMMNPTEFSVIPLARRKDGAIPKPIEALAENLERSSAIIWGQLNEGRRIDKDIIFNQLVLPYGIMQLDFSEFIVPEQPEWMKDEVYADYVDYLESQWMPWSVHTPYPMTCAWLEHNDRPIIFTRRYKTLVRSVEEKYSKRRGSEEVEANLRIDTEGRWAWRSDDYSVLDSRSGGASFSECEVLYMDDGKYIYEVALNISDGNGQVVWSQPNPVGSPLAFIVPGNVTSARRVEEKYEPYLWPLMAAIATTNDIRSMRATAARNLAGPRNYVPIDPEIVKIYKLNNEKLPTSTRFKANELHYLLGKVESMPSELSPDFDRLEVGINEEIQRYLPSPFIRLVDPAVIKSATATSILHAAEAGMRLYGPLMSAYDSAIRLLFESIYTAVRTYYPELSLDLHASGDEVSRGKNLKQGSVYRLTPDSVNFPYRLSVKTRSMSQAQAAAQYDLALRQWILPDGSRGPITFDDLIDAANFTDRIAQTMKLAKESIVGDVDPWIRQMAIEKTREKVLLDSGIDLPIGQQVGAAQQPAGIPGGAQRMDAPLIGGPEGGSEPTMEGQIPNV